MEIRQQRSDPVEQVQVLRAKAAPLPDLVPDTPDLAPTFSDEPDGITITARRRRRRLAEPIDWYVIIDEVVDEGVLFEAWPWPTLNQDTGYLSFDLNAATTGSVTVTTLSDVVNELRSGQARDRPLRIGDTFRVTSDRVQHPTTWQALEDVTAWARRKAQAAMYSMAAPPLPPEQALEMAEIARQVTEEKRPFDAPGQAYPKV